MPSAMLWAYLCGLLTLPVLSLFAYVLVAVFVPRAGEGTRTWCLWCEKETITSRTGTTDLLASLRSSAHIWLHHREDRREWQELNTRKDHWWSKRVYDPTMRDQQDQRERQGSPR